MNRLISERFRNYCSIHDTDSISGERKASIFLYDPSTPSLSDAEYILPIKFLPEASHFKGWFAFPLPWQVCNRATARINYRTS